MNQRHLEVKPAELRPGDVLPYQSREAVERVEVVAAQLVNVYFVGGAVKTFTGSARLTVLRTA